ncbi:MAG: hypothetical protein KDB23_20540 [Planctomycetales bacterium]|nr:hypothetical protein [Planctomycetales bacterium]
MQTLSNSDNLATLCRSLISFLIVLAIITVAFATYFFGPGALLSLAVLFSVPIVVGIRLFYSNRRIERREAFYFVVVVSAVAVAVCVTMAGWANAGWHHYRADKRELRRLNSMLAMDSRYKNVSAGMSSKVVVIEGSVSDNGDLERLNNIVEERKFHMTVLTSVVVEGVDNGELENAADK